MYMIQGLISTVVPAITSECLRKFGGVSKDFSKTADSIDGLNIPDLLQKKELYQEQAALVMQTGWANLMVCANDQFTSNGNYALSVGSLAMGLGLFSFAAADIFEGHGFESKQERYSKAAVKILCGIGLTCYGAWNINAAVHTCCENK